MNRQPFGIVLGLGIVCLAANTAVFSDDKVERVDRQTEKVESVSGKIVEETVAGVKIKTGAKETLVPTQNIFRVYYEDVPISSKQAYINLWNLETNEKDLSKVLKGYQDFQPRATSAPFPVQRNISYKIAMLQAATADTKTEKEEARRNLQQFLVANPASWQFSLASRDLARLQVDLEDYDGAQRTLEGVIRSNQIPAEIRQQADSILVDVLFRANKIPDLKTKITAAMADPKTTPQQKARFGVYQAAIKSKDPTTKFDDVVKELTKIIDDRASDSAIKGLAYNVLGDCYVGKDMKREAMWSYLWVDVVYNQDRAEHLKAMNALYKIFDDEKDLEKAQLYKDKIARLK